MLERFARHEARLEAGPYLPYKEVLAGCLRALGEELGFAPTDERGARLRHLGHGLARVRRQPGRAPAAQAALQARGHHELRRRPLRRLQPPPRRRVRPRHHRRAGARLQAPHRELRVRLRAHRRPARAHPARRPEPLPRPRAGEGAGHDDGLDRPPPGQGRRRGHAARRRARPTRPSRTSQSFARRRCRVGCQAWRSTLSTRTASRASPRPCRTCGPRSRRSTSSARSGSRARASDERAALVVFPELGLSAYAIDDLFQQDALTDARPRRARSAIVDGQPRAVAGARRRRRRCAREHGVFNVGVRDPPRRACSASCPRATCPTTASTTRSASSAPRASSIGDSVELLGQTVPFGTDLVFARRRPARPRAARRDLRGRLGAAPAEHLRRAGRRDGAREPVGEQHHGRQGRLPAHAVHGAVRAHDRGLHLHRRRAAASRRPTSRGTGRR